MAGRSHIGVIRYVRMVKLCGVCDLVYTLVIVVRDAFLDHQVPAPTGNETRLKDVDPKGKAKFGYSVLVWTEN